MLMVLLKETDYATEIIKIKNDYATNAALNSTLNDLAQKMYVDSELKKVNDEAHKNSSDILSYESKIKQKEDRIDDLEKKASYFTGKNDFYTDYLFSF